MPLNPMDYDYFCRLIYAKSGIVLEVGKEYLVEARLEKLVREYGLTSAGQLIDRLRASAHDPLHAIVVNAMTTNETSFFRDQHPFDALRQTILPELLAARAASRTLSIWCGASSAGQEPYTIAMVLQEAIPLLSTWRIDFVSTDLSSEMIARSRAGRYSKLEVGRGLPPALLAKYFDKVGDDYQAKKVLRDMVSFQELNLTQPWPSLPACDLVFLRNVLIYFDAKTKRDILARMRRVLRPDGYLFLGSAETTMSLDDEYERVAIDRSGAYRRRRASVGVARVA